ncbi:MULTISPECIES: hypothetical protein [unclassified Arthrobacter]|uniref:hypothetical protein n=1 Tax=unclassified Arthrobacter TaxID=235627 RepID=UPI001E2B214D|nr:MULTISPECIES: hypothetical protein [unclassified Arthrobacter]MCC9146351.1 hypothetical protein [Arthrobacter sp. zg-Y919]MDK1277581.1 hypothetical protein [Arthrobacter sp. zg.Y919]WIB02457.1 hypothetical protein QNO10_10865 [Arthrobacter sp. zg-Y919]
MNFFKARVRLWPLLLITFLVLAGMGAAFAFGGLNAVALKSLFTSSSSERDSQVVQSVTRIQEVALLSLYIEGVARAESNREILGVAIPASETTTLIQYKFDAKLGIDGSQVKIEPTGPESFLVTIPEFIGIGFDEPVFEDAVEDKKALSWLAPPAVQTRMINNILSDENKQKYISQNEAELKEQAKVFYSGIIAGVDPEVTVAFEFAG